MREKSVVAMNVDVEINPCLEILERMERIQRIERRPPRRGEFQYDVSEHAPQPPSFMEGSRRVTR
jgi:hypothetical protein